ncbi:MAG: hypothetical protein KBT04_02925 [Bacteroidales bacterium]|nr:hypothetical protein [Candidatus Colimorpha onthohippi]
MKPAYLLVLCAIAAVLLWAGCSKDKDKSPKFSESNLIGKWSSGTEFWRYDADHSGRTWDTADDVNEDDETTMRFAWSLDGDQLKHVFSGDEVHQAVAQYYTVKVLNATTLQWDDGLEVVTFTKVKVD